MPLEQRESDGQQIYTASKSGEVLGFVVVDSTIAGRARGGLRLVGDLSEAEIRAAARSMTRKYGFLGLPQGGAKAGLRGDDEAQPPAKRARLLEFAREIEPLLRERRYLPDADLGTRGDDIRWMLEAINIPVKRREWRGTRSGHYTAASCLAAALATRGGSLAGCSVAIEGFGSVGSSLASLLRQRGAKLVAVSTTRGALYDPAGLDVDALLRLSTEVGSRAVEQYDAERLPREELLELPVDLLCPCARFHSINEDNADRVRAPIIAPGANDPISPAAEAALHARGILCLPDFVTNCGGVLGGTLDFTGVSAERIEALVIEQVQRAVASLIGESAERNLPVRAVAESLAAARLEQTRAAAENPTLRSRVFSMGMECYRRGWVPRVLMATLAPRFVGSLRSG